VGTGVVWCGVVWCGVVGWRANPSGSAESSANALLHSPMAEPFANGLWSRRMGFALANGGRIGNGGVGGSIEGRFSEVSGDPNLLTPARERSARIGKPHSRMPKSFADASVAR
jgi:hypothetical protein